ncbi:Transporter [Entamoeba marina]
MLFDFGVFFFWLVIPVLLKDLGASPLIIGFADAITFGVAGVLAPLSGILSEIWRGEILCQFASIFQAICCIFTGLVYLTCESLWPLTLLLILQGIGFSMFWSPVETIIVSESYIGEENKNLSNFAMLSCFGKAIGFLLGGSVTVLLGNTYSLYFAGGLTLFIFIIFPRKPKYRNDEYNPNAKSISISEKKNPMLFYITSLVVHLFCYGVIAIISNQYVDYADDQHIILKGISTEASVFTGVFLFTENIVQTITIIIFGRWNGWQFKMIYNFIAFVILLTVCSALRLLDNGYIILLLAIPMGIVAGYEFQANLFYSVNTDVSNGKCLGISEFVGEITYCVSPVVSGLFCSFFGKEYLFYVAMVMCGCGLFGVTICSMKDIQTKIKSKREANEEKEMLEMQDYAHSRDSMSRDSMDISRNSLDTSRNSFSYDTKEGNIVTKILNVEDVVHLDFEEPTVVETNGTMNEMAKETVEAN